MDQAKILDIKIDKITTEEVLEKIKSFLLSNSQHHIITLNPEMVVEARKNDYFKKVINEADVALADGIGILWGLDFTKRKESLYSKIIKPLTFIFTLLKLLFSPKHRQEILQHRIHGIDLIYKICEAEFIKDKKIYLLGAGEGVAEETAEVLSNKYSYLNIVGAEEGIRFGMWNLECGIWNKIQNIKYQIPNEYPISNKNKLNKLNDILIQRINNARPDIIFVAFGAPKQEVWIYENLKKLPGVKLAIGIGGSFDFISGETKRAPLILRKLGLEWLWRLILEPRRIKRIYNATVKFGWLVWREKNKYV